MEHVDAKTLQQWLDKEEAVLIDVREPEEHQANNIPHAHLKPLSDIAHHDFSEFMDKKVVMHCKSGKRGLQACQKLKEMAPQLEVYNLEGGIDAWQRANLQTQKSASSKMSLEQQGQLTIGSLILLASILTYYYSPLFVFITGFLGTGLVVAAIRGSCAIVQLMAKMPWNREKH